MTNLFFDTPYWILGALAIVGAALFVTGNNRTDTKLRAIGLGVAAIGLLMFLLSWAVDTDEEKCIKQSKALVKAVEARDWETLDKLIAPRFKLSILGAFGVTYSNKSQMMAAVKTAVERHGLKSAKVLSSEAKNNVDFISIDLTVFSDQDVGYGLTSSWQFDWQEMQDGWMLKEISAKRIGNQGGDQIRRMFPLVP